MDPELSGTQLFAAASQVLSGSGYSSAPMPRDDSWQAYPSRVFEDRYGIVAVYIFETWASLVEDWPMAQGQLVELMSQALRRPEPKTWEGYLVLMTPGLVPVGERVLINRLRADTNRVRKLVATGDELATLQDVRTFLLPLVPLALDESLSGEADLLESLPELLEFQGVRPLVTNLVLTAFAANESIFQRLHDGGSTP